jgi:hypothetical protein
MPEIPKITPLAENPSKHKEKKVPLVPKNWTTLYHGTNLIKQGWQGKENLLEQDSFTITGMGLSVITEEARQEQRALSAQGGRYDTTGGYALSTEKDDKGQPVEIRVLFPIFNDRMTNIALSEIKAEYTTRYGEERAKNILQRTNQVYWRNIEKAPVLPTRMILDKLESHIDENGRRVITYVPHELRDIYENELQKLQ